MVRLMFEVINMDLIIVNIILILFNLLLKTNKNLILEIILFPYFVSFKKLFVEVFGLKVKRVFKIFQKFFSCN